MRIQLEPSRRRPWPFKLIFRVVTRMVGVVPGPMLVVTYWPSFFHRDLRGYILRPMRASDAWSKGEAELMAAFVSNLNSCHF